MMLEVQQHYARPAMTEQQEIRKYCGEALREPVRWNEHPGWVIAADREARGETVRVDIVPPPAFTPDDVHALICGRPSPLLHTCASCGHATMVSR
jgi:hypothetical protein